MQQIASILLYTTESQEWLLVKGGSEIEKLRNKLNTLTDKKVHINVIEIKKIDIDAFSCRKYCTSIKKSCFIPSCTKQSYYRAMKNGAKGIKTQVSGRLGGADIARAEQYSEGTVPLHTLRADIDYAR